MNRDNFPSSIRVDLEIAYSEGMKAVPDTSYTKLIEIVPSTSNSKIEVFYGDQPRMRRWRGERQAQTFNEYKMNINSDQWELTKSFKRKDFANDQSGGRLMQKAKEFGTEFELSKQQEFFEFLRNGASIMGFDKANLYDFNHRYVTSSGATISAVAAQSNMNLGGSALDAATLQLERAAYAQYVTDKNQKWGLQLTDILVYQGSANHKAAMELNNSSFTVEANTVKGTMTENVFKGSFNIMTTVYGLGTTDWISFALNFPQFKPVKVLSETVNPGFDNPRFTTLGLEPSNESSESFYRGEVAMGIEANFDYNPGYWFTTILHGSSSYSFTPLNNESQRVLYPNI